MVGSLLWRKVVNSLSNDVQGIACDTKTSEDRGAVSHYDSWGAESILYPTGGGGEETFPGTIKSAGGNVKDVPTVPGSSTGELSYALWGHGERSRRSPDGPDGLGARGRKIPGAGKGFESIEVSSRTYTSVREWQIVLRRTSGDRSNGRSVQNHRLVV